MLWLTFSPDYFFVNRAMKGGRDNNWFHQTIQGYAIASVILYHDIIVSMIPMSRNEAFSPSSKATYGGWGKIARPLKKRSFFLDIPKSWRHCSILGHPENCFGSRKIDRACGQIRLSKRFFFSDFARHSNVRKKLRYKIVISNSRQERTPTEVD